MEEGGEREIKERGGDESDVKEGRKKLRAARRRASSYSRRSHYFGASRTKQSKHVCSVFDKISAKNSSCNVMRTTF
jgi:hypothetical protein